ncbi:isoprenoid synthase domain-containing protein [Lipomyces oligophaga]|uniref:isoprenoid synthase domain-containing protein n=1 Tax=Lipomyces oligophaga TaxID=45792 RepID=UPI0034CE708F
MQRYRSSISRAVVMNCRSRRLSHFHSSSRALTNTKEPSNDSDPLPDSPDSPLSMLFSALFSNSAESSAERASVPGSKAFSDPLSVVAAEMTNLTTNIHMLLGSGQRSLDAAAKYYVQSQGKHIRPLLVLLMSRASLAAPKREHAPNEFRVLPNVDENISPLDILRDFNPAKVITSIATTVRDHANAVAAAAAAAAASTNLDPAVEKIDPNTGVLPSQRRLAEITEMIHAASLLHDDVIDDAEMRRGQPSGNFKFGNKMSILAGDFLLGRACVSLARLRNTEVTELISTAIVNLVEGEVMQLKNTAPEDSLTGTATQATFKYYLDKTYLKTASLMSKSCRSAAVLAGIRQDAVEAAYQYGRNLGMAFQLVDDLLDYTVSEADLGKPAGADLQLGLATAPALFAWYEYPELGPMIRRKFSQSGDVARARELVAASNGVEQTRMLAEKYSAEARDALALFPESSAKEALVDMTYMVLNRRN